MNAISKMPHTNDHEHSLHSATRASQVTMGLGPNQLTWLRRNIDSFKYAEEQWRQIQQDAMRSARIAGLI